MPVIITPDPLITGGGKCRDQVESSPSQLLRCVSPSDSKYPILRSSFTFPDHGNDASPSFVAPAKNGLTHAVIRAWQQDLHLKLRPDDVWLAILTQFTFAVNAYADSLRSLFVSHQGRLPLALDASPDSVETVDVGAVARQLAAMVRQKLKDPGIATTLLPEFTTTTSHDRATAAMVFLGTMREYFSYDIHFGCSFPSVTLLGERRDWADILARIAWLATVVGGREEAVAAWAARLAKVLEYMVASFDRPGDADVRRFWTSAVHQAGGRSSGAVTTLSGWLTAFCWWSADGERVKDYYSDDGELAREGKGKDGGCQRLVLDGVGFPVIDRERIPAGVVRAPLALHHGPRTEKVVLLAGSMGMEVLIEEDDEIAVRPASGWWMLATSS
ncbi:hypothetical protein MYCTH_2295502 [Thermothelomyces thermophilus ATCC 42464]|uniref:DUF4419 domain-containing protein n=1 Tax=Thermothelomyces thermophilus (strain ATCC 42464 / BCRC 31852 / DSM 1799) TaxID=573729 RepID=G2Q509_THET4|nr:uncharacterized protein MYCTH_2295502 [Thermothelomyces thermophilus ATCC 42464]AEO53746.1 hypothetical protein MYCTH_2295502 [Thermothelomyces thermophilus ATCC 42464]